MGTCIEFNFKELYEKDYNVRSIGEISALWHYTNAEGLMGVVRNDKAERGKLHFWFTRSDCLNDPSEGTHIMGLYRSVCDEMLSRGEISQGFFDAVSDAEIASDQFINFPVPAEGSWESERVAAYVPCHAYICSFSLKEDSLDMWRYYSKGKSGYGLRCSADLFSSKKSSPRGEGGTAVPDEVAPFVDIHAYPVIYDDAAKKKILRELISDAFCAYGRIEDERVAEKGRAAKGLIQTVLKRLQFEFKHECYASEHEYRFVVYRPKEDVKAEFSLNGVPELRFRAQDGILVPYVDLAIEGGNAFLKEVLVSPFIENEFVLDTTREYLAQCGYDCEVRQSELPVR